MTANWKCSVKSKHIGVVFPTELVEKLTREAQAEGMSFPRAVRCACIEYLSRRNVDVSSIPNPVSRGERTDLAKPPQKEPPKKTSKGRLGRARYVA